MSLAWFRFYEELNEFLTPEKRKLQFPYFFSGSPTVKDAVEALGVPHVEVDLILVNGVSVDFVFRIRNEDSVSVYPVFESLDISSLTHLRKEPLRELKFILDVHLGKLAKYLRLCGFDTFYNKDLDDKEIIRLSLSEKRIILTRDLGILKNKRVTHGYWLRSQYLTEQIKEVFRRFDLIRQLKPFSRCMECNGLLTDISKDEIIDRLLPKTSRYYQSFKKCNHCDHIYWEGSHYSRMKKYIDSVIENL